MNRILGTLTQEEFHSFANEIAAADGVAAFNDDSLFGFTAMQQFTVRDNAEKLQAVAVAKEQDLVFAAELAVRPEARRHGIGSSLLAKIETVARKALNPDSAVLAASTNTVRLPPTVKVWAHGALAGQADFMANNGYQPVRELFKLQLQLDSFDADLAKTKLQQICESSGTQIQPFSTADASAWVALNHRIFRTHPEQGQVTLEMLSQRLSADWAKPENFLLLTDAVGELIGYNWLKVTPEEAELYVLGVAPEYSGKRLGTAILLAGLIRTQELGFSAQTLYVDASNVAAVQLYRKYGFETVETHTQYAKELRLGSL